MHIFLKITIIIFNSFIRKTWSIYRYNQTTLSNVNSSGGSFGNALGMLRADAADDHIDGTIDGVDYSSQMGDVDLVLENGGAAVTGTDLTYDNTNVVCFTAGTLIGTLLGPVRVEDLKAGDDVLTLDTGTQKIRWIGSTQRDSIDLVANPKLRPVRITAGALGDGLPAQDLLVSRLKCGGLDYALPKNDHRQALPIQFLLTIFLF